MGAPLPRRRPPSSLLRRLRCLSHPRPPTAAASFVRRRAGCRCRRQHGARGVGWRSCMRCSRMRVSRSRRTIRRRRRPAIRRRAIPCPRPGLPRCPGLPRWRGLPCLPGLPRWRGLPRLLALTYSLLDLPLLLALRVSQAYLATATGARQILVYEAGYSMPRRPCRGRCSRRTTDWVVCRGIIGHHERGEVRWT